MKPIKEIKANYPRQNLLEEQICLFYGINGVNLGQCEQSKHKEISQRNPI